MGSILAIGGPGSVLWVSEVPEGHGRSQTTLMDLILCSKAPDSGIFAVLLDTLQIKPSPADPLGEELLAVAEIGGFYGPEFTIGLLKTLQYQPEMLSNCQKRCRYTIDP